MHGRRREGAELHLAMGGQHACVPLLRAAACAPNPLPPTQPRPVQSTNPVKPLCPGLMSCLQIGQGGGIYLDHSLPTLFENTVFSKG